MAPTFAWVLAVLLLLAASLCLLDRDLGRACQAFVAFALLMSLAWLLLGAPWLALAEALLGALLTGGTLLWTLRGRGALPRLSPVDETARQARRTAPLRWLLILSWLGLTGIALVWLLGVEALTPPRSASTLLAATGVPIMGLGLWAFGTQRHLLRRLLAFNLLGSGVFLLLTGLAAPASVPTAEMRALILIGLVVALLGSMLGAALLLRLHARAGQVALSADFNADFSAAVSPNARSAMSTGTDPSLGAGTSAGSTP
ncbi:MAG: hydrogenase subunit MbhD domain-containing protein [Halochromatium sp.]